MKLTDLKDPRDRAFCEQQQKTYSIHSTINMPEKVLKNWCPSCREYKSDNHSQVTCATSSAHQLAV
jgi:hypothetical protein